jgi:hypothetical protein
MPEAAVMSEGLFSGGHLVAVAAIAVVLAAAAVVAGVAVRDRRRVRDCADLPEARMPKLHGLAAVVVVAVTGGGSSQAHKPNDAIGWAVLAGLGLILYWLLFGRRRRGRGR